LSRFRLHIIALSVSALAAVACSKAPTKEELLARAKEAAGAQDYVQAEKDYRAVLRLSPGDPAAVRELAAIYHNQRQLAQSRPLLKKAAELAPDDAEVQIDFAESSLAGGDFLAAHDAAVKVLKKHPGYPRALILLANAAATPAAAAETRTLVLSLREKDEDRAGYHLALGALALRERDETGAQTEFEAAAKLEPNLPQVHTALAALAWSRKDLKTADEAFKTAVGLSPLRSTVRVRYADFRLRTGAPAEAKAILEEITPGTPTTCRHGCFR
jgi:Tfp pilus assembly protein PilF